MIEKIDYNRELMEGFRTAAINMEYQSNPEYRPEFLSNNPRIGKKIFVSIEQELMCCDQFKISVAFITKSGITPLLQVFRELEKNIQKATIKSKGFSAVERNLSNTTKIQDQCKMKITQLSL